MRIAFKLKSFQKNNIWFNVNFGTGSIYGSGEESLMLREANKKGLKIYEYRLLLLLLIIQIQHGLKDIMINSFFTLVHG